MTFSKIIIIILFSSFLLVGCSKNETSELSYSVGYLTMQKHVESDYGIFWFLKTAYPEISDCNLSLFENTLRNAFKGDRLALRNANLKMHDFADEQREGKTIDLDSLSVVYATILYWNKFREELLQFPIDVEELIHGINDGLNSKNRPQKDEDKMRKLFNDYFEFQLPTRNMAKTLEYFSSIETSTPGIQRLENGLLYRIDEPGIPDKLMNSDDFICEVDYSQTVLLGGIASGRSEWAYDINRPFSSLRYPFFQEAIMKIGVGGKITVWAHTGLLNETIFENGTNPNMPMLCTFILTGVSDLN